MGARSHPGLERSCADWIRVATPAPGLERVEASFAGLAYGPHRHDTYAIGCTVQGVQAFRYRGNEESCLAGQVFVLHPDETHDGRAGTAAGFRYRSLYVEPGAIRDALDGQRRALPFVREAVSNDRQIAAAIMPALIDLDRPLESLERDDIIARLADALVAAEGAAAADVPMSLDWQAVGRVRALLDDRFTETIHSSELEAASGHTRYGLSRHFRACLGTSPYRYLIMRRLDRARALIHQGTSLAIAASISGFADQGHMTRHFRRAFGLTPGRWKRLSSHFMH